MKRNSAKVLGDFCGLLFRNSEEQLIILTTMKRQFQRVVAIGDVGRGNSICEQIGANTTRIAEPSKVDGKAVAQVHHGCCQTMLGKESPQIALRLREEVGTQR